MLRRLHFAPGPVDGIAGPRTTAAVTWFQALDAVRPTGTLDAVTLAHLRARTRSAGRGRSTSPATAPPPMPSAGWRGRPILHPLEHDGRLISRAVDRSLPHGPKGVRRLQRLLHHRGYEPGPVDGLLGPRTRSSLQWFQFKHGLRPTGKADATTLRHLRAPGHASRPPGHPVAAGHTPHIARAAAGPPRPVTVRSVRLSGDRPPLAWGAVVLLALLAIAALGVLAVRRRRHEPPTPVPATTRLKPVHAPDRSARAVRGLPRAGAVGYARGLERAELDRQAAAIRRTCAERGWPLARVVREGGAGRRRPGLKHALEHLAGGQRTRLVVAEARHLGDTPAEVALKLGWCARHRIAVVALDVGLDTATREGRTAARLLFDVVGRDLASKTAAAGRTNGGRPPRSATGERRARS
jgi:peptidoglycan hydrolase-like protein with peptidoglycan-binding domain